MFLLTCCSLYAIRKWLPLALFTEAYFSWVLDFPKGILFLCWISGGFCSSTSWAKRQFYPISLNQQTKILQNLQPDFLLWEGLVWWVFLQSFTIGFPMVSSRSTLHSSFLLCVLYCWILYCSHFYRFLTCSAFSLWHWSCHYFLFHVSQRQWHRHLFHHLKKMISSFSRCGRMST